MPSGESPINIALLGKEKYRKCTDIEHNIVMRIQYINRNWKLLKNEEVRERERHLAEPSK